MTSGKNIIIPSADNLICTAAVGGGWWRTHQDDIVNGKPATNSRGLPISLTEEGLSEFWSWFGDSKAVDGEGRPMVLYHGTQAQFDKFCNDFIGSHCKQDKMGLFFTSSLWMAEGFAHSFDPQPGDTRGNVMEVYLSIANPISYSEVEELTGEPIDREYDIFSYDDNVESVAELAMGGTYDGVIFGGTYVVFDAGQVRMTQDVYVHANDAGGDS